MNTNETIENIESVHPKTSVELEILESLDGKNIMLHMMNSDSSFIGRFEFSYGHYLFTIGQSDELLVDLIDMSTIREV